MLSPVDDILADLRAGRPVIVVDDEGRENEGDLCLAAELVSAATVNFLCRFGRGLVCVAMEGSRLDALDLPLMVPPNRNRSVHSTAFTVSVDARHGVTTGISAADRATTIRTLAHPATKPEDLVRPGHVFPLRARDGGLRERAGHTEAAVELMRLAGLYPAAALCEILRPDGTMARRPHLRRFARRHHLRVVSVEQIAHHVDGRPSLRRVAEAELPTRFGPFRMVGYVSQEREYVALLRGTIPSNRTVPVGIHRRCLVGDLLGGTACGCRERLDDQLRYITAAGGILIYCCDPNATRGCRDSQAMWSSSAVRATLGAILTDLGVRRVTLLLDQADGLRQGLGPNVQVEGFTTVSTTVSTR